jgi:tRNA(Ile)-lysidine synthase
MALDAVQTVDDSVRAVTRVGASLVLAVSGGLDSMVLLRAVASVAPSSIAAVATFHHGTGDAATAASELVRRSAAACGLPFVIGHAESLTFSDGREAAWRDARYRFLRETAARPGARVVTAHSEDDQVETVLMRVMRGSGARGLAALRAPSDVVRPFLGIRRSVLEAYALAKGVSWIDDPSNESREFLRNRVRHDLLPALRRADAGIDGWLLDLSARSARLRVEIEEFVSGHVRPVVEQNRLVVAAAELSGYDRDSLRMLWNALAGRVGLALDVRGTQRLAEFTMSEPRGGVVPLAGGWCLEAVRGTYILKQRNVALVRPVALPQRGWLHWGRFRFRVDDGSEAVADTSWRAAFDAEGDALVVREWTDGDRLAPSGGQPRRRVKRYLAENGVRGGERAGWPVVVAGDDVVWIPGVRRSDAATDRSGRPVRHYVCERIDR